MEFIQNFTYSTSQYRKKGTGSGTVEARYSMGLPLTPRPPKELERADYRFGDDHVHSSIAIPWKYFLLNSIWPNDVELLAFLMQAPRLMELLHIPIPHKKATPPS